MNDPHDAYDDPRLSAAARMLAEGRHDAALEFLLDTWKADPDNIDLAIAYASTLARSARETEAEELFSSLADDCPKDPRIWNNWGYLLLSRGESGRAVKKLEMALELAPEDFEAMVNMGIALDRMGRSDESLAFYKRALALNPDSPVVYNNMGAALWRSGNADAALDAFRNALRLNPRDASAANNTGIILMSGGNHAGAEGFFKQALEIDPDSKAARKNLAAAIRQRKAAHSDHKETASCKEKPPSLF